MASREAIPTPDDLDEDSEPPYETIPSVPPNINNFVIAEAIVTSEASARPPAPLPPMHQDESVISAHDVTHTGIYNITTTSMTSVTSPSAVTLNHGKNVELLRKKLLMQDANETRL